MSSAMSSVTSSIMASGDLERRVLEESLAVVTEQSYLMKQAIVRITSNRTFRICLHVKLDLRYLACFCGFLGFG